MELQQGTVLNNIVEVVEDTVVQHCIKDCSEELVEVVKGAPTGIVL